MEKDPNQEYREAVVHEIAKKLKDNGYALATGKTIGLLLGVVFALISVIYYSLVSADAAQKSDISSLQSQQINIDLQLQSMAGNIYLLCQSSGVRCVKPDSLVK